MSIKKRIAAVLLISIMTFAFAGCREADHNDGKCDICGKAVEYSGQDEEYCAEHFKNAVEWYANH